MSDNKIEANAEQTTTTNGIYSHYVLFILVLVYILNFVDRNILSILAQDIKVDLGATDAQMGFLYGTVFAIFYAIFGLPLARFADVWVRRSLISGGLLFWSAMTVFSGFARSFPMLALCRMGVGIGEASASPAAFSLLSDYYSPRFRATVLAIYSSGIYIGLGVGMFIGGYVLDTWTNMYPVDPPLGLKGWQVAFMVVGLPGVLLAAWVRTLREPPRGISEGIVAKKHPAPFRLLGTELATVIPPLNIFSIIRHGASLKTNLIGALVISAVAYILILLTGNPAQWIALGFGVYISFSWTQCLKVNDPATYFMMFKSKAFVFSTLAFPTISFVTFGVSFWFAPLLMRLHSVSPTEVGLYIGLTSAAGGLVGAPLGGILADRMKLKFASGRLLLGVIGVFGIVPMVLIMVHAENVDTAYYLNFFYYVFASLWVGVPPATASDLVMPRMRAVATAYYILISTFIGLALGPYCIGLMSDLFLASGMNDAESLRTAISYSLLIFIPTLIFLAIAGRHLAKDEDTKLARAKALGEPV
ncbi:MAG: MFS transporter [Gammaproteobacteria bacterium]|nr:MAG: MFS transporter [Gammaproteobacteria bacterium]